MDEETVKTIDDIIKHLRMPDYVECSTDAAEMIAHGYAQSRRSREDAARKLEHLLEAKGR